MLNKIILTLFLFGFSTAAFGLDYFQSEPIDVVIPVAPKDRVCLEYCIKGVKKYCQNVRRIITISDTPLTSNAEWFDEKWYPFTKSDVAYYLNQENAEEARKYLKDPHSRIGWYYQQLLKLYAAFVIPGISNNILIVDSDTIFLTPVTFIDGGVALYNVGTEFHLPYFVHASQLIPGFTRCFDEYSGVVHHMLFQKNVLIDLFNLVENYHQDEFWKAFCKNVNKKELRASGASEYEIYFNFAFLNGYPINIRHLRFANKPPIDSDTTAKNLIRRAVLENLDYISCHVYR